MSNGFLQLPMEYFEALIKLRIPGEARQVFDFILRKTFGWQKQSDIISLSQFREGTGLGKVTICKAINKLLSMNLITKKGNAITQKGNDVNVTYCINCNTNSWKPLPKKVTLPKKVKGITQKGKKPLPKKVHTIDTITKDTITKEKKKFGEHVLLTENEYSKLVAKFGKVVTDVWIEKANIYAEKIGVKAFNKKYVSHYATILTWDTMKKERDGVGLEEPKKLVLVDYKGRKVTHKERLELERKEKENEQ